MGLKLNILNGARIINDRYCYIVCSICYIVALTTSIIIHRTKEIINLLEINYVHFVRILYRL